MHPATTQALAIVQQGAPDGAASPEMLVARMIAELVSQNDQIRRLIQNPGSTVLLDDDGTIFFDNVDPTKRAKLQLSGLTTGTTRTLTLPDGDMTLLGEATTQTITNKSIGAGQLTGDVATARIANALTAPGPIGGTTPGAGSFATLGNSGLHTTTLGAANTGAWAVTGHSLTGSNAGCMVDLAGTWNTSGVPTAFKLAMTDTASGLLSNLFHFYYTNAGGTQFAKLQRLTSTTCAFSVGGLGASIRLFEAAESAPRFLIGGTAIKLGSATFLSWTGTTLDASASAVIGFYKEDSNTLALCDGTTLANYRDFKIRKLILDATMTAAGTTGARTINKGAGSVNFAAGASTLVVTNSLVTTASIILAVVDSSQPYSVQRVVAGAGSFTIYLNTTISSETAVKWVVVN